MTSPVRRSVSQYQIGSGGSPRGRGNSRLKPSHLHRIFDRFCAFGAGKTGADTEMDNAHFAKFCRDCRLLDASLTAADVDLIHTKARGPIERRINYTTFREVAIPLVAARKNCTVKELIAFIKESEGPASNGTKAEAVKWHDDKAMHTGVFANKSQWLQVDPVSPTSGRRSRSSSPQKLASGSTNSPTTRAPSTPSTPSPAPQLFPPSTASPRRDKQPLAPWGVPMPRCESDPGPPVEQSLDRLPSPRSPCGSGTRVLVPSVEMARVLNALPDGGGGCYKGVPIEVQGLGLYNDLVRPSAAGEAAVERSPSPTPTAPRPARGSPMAAPDTAAAHTDTVGNSNGVKGKGLHCDVGAQGFPSTGNTGRSDLSVPSRLFGDVPGSPASGLSRTFTDTPGSPATRLADIEARLRTSQTLLALFQAQCSQLCACLQAANVPVPWEAVRWSKGQVQSYFQNATDAPMTEAQWQQWRALLPPPLTPT
jgi:hypothetical protein